MSATFDPEGLGRAAAKGAGPTAAAWHDLLTARWQALAPRERRGVTLAAAVLGLYLAWALALAPAWRTLRELPPRIAQAEEELRQMRRLGDEALALRAQPAVRAEQSEAALRAATARLGASATLGPLQGDRVTITFKALAPAELAAWLAEVRHAARARVLDAQLRRNGSTYDGSATLVLAPRA
jgi:general secretion pathway protein M